MRLLPAEVVGNTVAELVLEASVAVGADVRSALEGAVEREESPMGRGVLEDILANLDIAREDRVAVCQDCGTAVVFVELGQEVLLTGGSLEEAVDEGVRQAYRDGYLRKSIVADPLYDRVNTGDNTPAVVHLRSVPGERVRIAVAPKGMGSENMSALRMMKAADGEEGVLAFVTETVRTAGPNPCPPVVVGVGIGSDFEGVALLAKRALLRPLGSRNPDGRYADLEGKILERVNRLGIGPGGYGGRVTALGVQVEHAPTHIAGMPVAVNICCHADRKAERLI
ncbi:MAG: fumarate hydratase [Synergistales bacterium]|nr:fumarate hydratase [Synergistales bacterium]